MTTIKVSKKNGKFTEIKAVGHTGYSEEGTDILCASVSTLIQSTALGLIKLVSKDVELYVNEITPEFKIIIPTNLSSSQYSQAELLIKSCLLGLEDLASGYPKNLKMEVKNDVY